MEYNIINNVIHIMYYALYKQKKSHSICKSKTLCLL